MFNFHHLGPFQEHVTFLFIFCGGMFTRAPSWTVWLGNRSTSRKHRTLTEPKHIPYGTLTEPLWNCNTKLKNRNGRTQKSLSVKCVFFPPQSDQDLLLISLQWKKKKLHIFSRASDLESKDNSSKWLCVHLQFVARSLQFPFLGAMCSPDLVRE